MKITAFLVGAAALAGTAAIAQPAVEDVKIDQRIIYGDDSCPPSTDDVIIVCARKPENDRYRIPENLRRNPNDPVNRTWADKAIELSYVGRTGTQSCSTVGGGGFTGCFDQLANAWRAERDGRDEVNWNQLIEEARQERLSRIDAEAEAIEREQGEPR
jgi:hypothetical protein